MDKQEIGIILESQRKYFLSGNTQGISRRLETLKKLRRLIVDNEQEIIEALQKDFHKPPLEVLATETRFVVKELNYAIKRLRRWVRPKKVRTPIVHFLASSRIEPQPYGQVLILSPWNYPFQLTFMPLLGALAAGNTVFIKVSQQVPEITKVIQKILGHFPMELITIINGDHSVSDYLLSQKFDYIFFTGSTKVGKYVMKKAAENLIPLSLELGGKNPCVVTADARLDFAAKRIVWGKFMNAGQTCICPDYLLVDRRIIDRFLDLLENEIRSSFGEKPKESSDFARVISRENTIRLSDLIKSGDIATGGFADPDENYVEPTVLKNVRPEDPVMQEEIFGPILPVIDYEEMKEVYDIISLNPKPLAVYIFTGSKKLSEEFLKKTLSGTAAINDTVIQIASPHLPYGGVGTSGMGRYHGKKSFETFSNMRSVVVKSNLLDLSIRYPPYNKIKEAVIKLLMR
jgi:acyl-CoA reductase-like NAD-dependent aldehyde dehydrogenase